MCGYHANQCHERKKWSKILDVAIKTLLEKQLEKFLVALRGNKTDEKNQGI